MLEKLHKFVMNRVLKGPVQMLLGVFFSVTFGWIAINDINWSSVWNHTLNLPILLGFLALLLFLGASIIRAFRWQTLFIQDRISVRRLFLIQNIGLFTVGNSLKASRIAGDLTETNARVISSVEETSKYKFISEKNLFDVEYWSLEQAKIKKKKKLLEGNVVVVTGSTGTIGFETYKMFKSYGAEVVLLDYDLKRLNEVQSKIKDLCIHCCLLYASPSPRD